METVIKSLLGQYEWIFELAAFIIAIASIIVKVTPTLKDDNFWLPLVKILGKIALNKYSPQVR